ncbi:DUF4396 domain-containing protein [Nocardioides sp.]|uniref:DUF4396 domain-containing protein n=1 Tax=Nocardioides sp. TaxID=35761 RepID=UPI00261E3FB7|nr:DUF4396 domain-containing protein [Nocardioides sp.]
MDEHTEHTRHETHADHSGHEMHGTHGTHDDPGALTSMAVAATLHCLTGCAIGEIAGLIIGTAAGIGNVGTIVISTALAFVFGFSLSSLPLLKAGLTVAATLSVVVAADTLSIATMEVVDNLVMAVIPGAMNAGLVNPTFWISMAISLAVAFVAAFPVNRILLARGQGHALTHRYHGMEGAADGFRARIPSFSTTALVAVLLAFMLGGLVVSIADHLSTT